MTTEHDEGFAAGIEAAATLCEDHPYVIWDGTRHEFPFEEAADLIRALKPAPRSAEHSAEPSAQERERFEALEEFLREIAACGIAWRRLPAVERALNTYLLATAPSPRIEAEPVAKAYPELPMSAGLSWDGFVIEGDKASIDKVKDLMHEAGHAANFKQMIRAGELRYAPPARTPDARSTSDAAVVLPEPDEGWHSYTPDQVRAIVLSDRATRSTDSSAEAAGMERAAKWVDDRADAYDRDHGTTDPDTGTRWWPGDGEDYMLELDEIATGIRAEAAKLTTAPHTADETRVDGGA